MKINTIDMYISIEYIVERVPFDVQDGSCVTGDFASGRVQPAGLLQRQDDERASAGHFRDDGYEFRIDGAAVGVVRVFGDLDVLVAALFARRLAEDVPEFRCSYAAERHLSEMSLYDFHQIIEQLRYENKNWFKKKCIHT